MRSWLRPHLLANHYPALHGLRVLAILSIVQLHVSMGFRKWGFPPPWYERSVSIWFGMDLFFLLSGFLIGSMLMRDPTSARPASAARFWARRAFRIIPPYYAVLAALTLAASPAQRANVWHEFAYLTNYFPVRSEPIMLWAWSLCVEEHFYLAVPLVLAAVSLLRSPARRMSALVALWGSGVALRVAFVASRSGWTLDSLLREVYGRTHLRYDILVAGVILAELQHHHGDRVRAALARPRVRAAAWALIGACFALLLWPPQVIPEPLRWSLWWGVLTAAMYGPLVLLLVNRESSLTRFLGARAFIVLATFGYGVYLVHIPVGDHVVVPAVLLAGIAALRAGVLLPAWLVWGVALALTWAVSVAIAYALHLAIERPALALRDRMVPTRS
ncbi:MAG: acyltransferase [Polyangiales bacterium]